MQITYFILLFTGLALIGTYINYRYTQKKGMVFRYKPVFLIIIVVLFLVSLYGVITGKPYNEILPFIR
jgi:MFS-type transporter involved in bile tolerance (Atg22 family)